MARRSPVRVGCALVLLCALGFAQTEDKCRTGCRGASQTFKLQEGTSYKYNFDSKVEISLSSADGQKSVTEVKATVLLTQQPQCNQVLKLQNVQIISSDGKKHYNLPDVEKAIRLNYHDGHLEDSICITPGDTQNSLNLKRAIASIFQANLKNGYETDVFGLCPTEVSHHKEGNVLVVQKSRNLNKCAYRESIGQTFFATAFNPDSEIKTSPILNAEYNAKLRIKNGILDQATIEENYLYVPYSVGNNGAKVNVETTLRLVETTKYNAQVKVSLPRSIIFEDPHPVTSPHSNVNSILQAVKNTAKTIDITVNENTANEFADLIRIFRVSKRDDLLAVYSQVRAGVGFADKDAARRIFLDALLTAGNGDNVEVAIELLKNKQLSEIEESLVYLKLSAVRHPTEGSITSAATLLSQPQLPRNAYLGIGNLIGIYCRQHSCEKVPAVNQIIQKLVQKLGTGKANNRQQENDIIFVLKALGNTNHISDNVLPKIIAIAQDKKTANRLRVTALETYLADPCKDKLRDSALTILKDIQQDSELRIRAYLVVAQCPNTKVGNAVKTLLENEPSYQVGGFIVSHIRNLRSSANPDKALAKQFLGLINVPKRFPLDPRKYSANGEFSYTIDSLGIANSIESNIIYSQKSFLPRSTSLNLTAEVFGHTFNFLEIQTRQENLDRLVEHYFGPKGILRAKSLQELWNTRGEAAKNLFVNLKEKLEQSLRTRRDVSKAEIDHIGKLVQIKTNELNNDLDLDFSVKAFGAEVLFLNVNDDIKKYTPEALVDKIVNEVNQGLDKIKHYEKTLRTNLQFLDGQFAYPTSSGFPLRLGIQGTANSQLKISSQIDLKALLAKDTTLKIALVPSVNLQIVGRLTIDTLLVENGLRVESNLHTSAGGDLVVDLKSDSLDIKYSLPVQKQNLLSVNHKIVYETRDWGVAEKITKLKFAQNKDFSICLDQLNDFIGLTLCAEFNGPNLQGENVPVLPFPFSGDAKLSASIEREDLSYYHYKETYYDNREKLGVEGLIEVVGQNGNKKLGFNVQASLYPEQLVRAELTSAVTNAVLEGRVTSTSSEKSVSLLLKFDENEYLAKVGVSIAGNSARKVYKPLIVYRTPENSGLQVPPFHVEGQIIAEEHGYDVKYTLENVRLIIPDQKTISVNGNFHTDNYKNFLILELSDNENFAKINGMVESVQFGFKHSIELTNSINPSANIRLKGEIILRPDKFSNYLQLSHGDDFSNKNNILTLENVLNYKNKDTNNYHFGTKNEISYPASRIDIELELDLKPKSFKYGLDVEYEDVKLGSSLELELNKEKDGDYELEFDIWGLNNKIELDAKRRLNPAGEISQVENSLNINGKIFEVNGKVKHHVKPQDIDVGTDLTVKVPSRSAPFHVLSGLKLNANDIDLSQKVTSGNQVFIDIILKANRAGNANGNIKISLKEHLVVNGHVTAKQGSGKADITIELPTVKKTAKLDSTFTIHDPNYNILLNIYPVYNEDKNKKITISTHSKITLNSVDSKNLIDFFGSKLEANVKGNKNGDWENGKINGEADITLPNNEYIAGKLNRQSQLANNLKNINGLVSLDYRTIKNQPGNKVTLSAQIKNTNYEDNIYDIQYVLNGEKANGQNINVGLNIKRKPQADLIDFEISNVISGSILDSPIETTVKTSGTGTSGSLDAKASYQPLGSININGKYDASAKPFSGQFNVVASSTSTTLRTLKVSGSGSLLKEDRVVLKASGNIYADNPSGLIADWSGTGEVESSDKDGRIKASVKSHDVDPISVEAGYKVTEGKTDQQIQGDLDIKYEKNQNINGQVSLIRLPKHEYKLDLKLNTPDERFRTNRVQVHTKRSEDNAHHQSEVIVTTNGKVWTGNTNLILSETTPTIDVKLKDPEGKLREILIKITNLSDRRFAGQIKLVNQPKNFLLEGAVDANVESANDFHIKISANSPALKIDKYVFEAQNKPAKAGRRILVTAKSGNKNILAGSTSYTSREEHGKLIIEGSGSFKVKDETKSANFKFIKENLVLNKHGEKGIEVSFDAGLGNKAIDAELKVTNKQFRILNSYCEEKKQCAHVEFDIKTNADDATSFNQVIEITIDLRKLGLSHEFGLKAVTIRKNYVLDHTVDIHFQNQEDSKYQYSLYLHPREAGVSLTTPKRVIALEGNVNIPPKVLKDGGRLSGEVVFYTDKKGHPNAKTSLTAYLNVNSKGDYIDGEAKFANPVLRRPLIISVKTKHTSVPRDALSTTWIVDIFATAQQKLIIQIDEQLPNANAQDIKQTIAIKSSGLGIEIISDESYVINTKENIYKYNHEIKYHVGNSIYNTQVKNEVSPKRFESSVVLFGVSIYSLKSKFELREDQQIVDSEYQIYDIEPYVTHLEIKNLNTLKLIVSRKQTPNYQLIINAGLISGQIADIRAEYASQGPSKELGHASVKLDDANFLKFDYDVNSKEIERFAIDIRKDGQEINGRFTELSNEIFKNVKTELKSLEDIARGANPNFAPLRQNYINELNKIENEILEDKTIKEVSEFLYNIFGAISQAVSKTIDAFSVLIENIANILPDFYGRAGEIINKEILPELQKISSKLVRAASGIADAISELVLAVAVKAAEIAEQYKPELQQLAALFGELTQDIIKAGITAFEAIKNVLVDQWNQIYDVIIEYPAVQQLIEEFEGFLSHGLPGSETIASTIKELLSTIKDVAPTPEFKALIDAIGEYVDLRLTGKPVDDKAAIEKIIKAAAAVFKQLVQLISDESGTPDLQNLKVPLPITILKQLPRLGAIKLSPLSYILREDGLIPDDFLLSLVNKPRNWLPPFRLYANIAQGQHIFTFDGKHLTFPGNCNYLLARDSVNGNFTVAGTYTKGLLTAISLTQASDTITLRKGGQVLLNNAPQEFPIRKPSIAAFRDVGTITLLSDYGVEIICEPLLSVCSVTASGFYHGQLRGLLGNGNNEPYDDFTIPSGKIVNAESEFGNSYKLTNGCPAVQTVSHAGHHPAPSCEKLFSWESSLRLCYPFVSTENYKLACEHGVSAGVKDTEKAIAVAYTSACSQHGISVQVPSQYVQCTNGNTPYGIGDKFSVKIPNNAVDFVVLINTNKNNEQTYKELVQPLVPQLTNELKSKGLTDVNFHFILYGGENEWPTHITVNNGKLAFQGKAPALKFTDDPKTESLVTKCSALDGFIEVLRDVGYDIKLAAGLDLAARTYVEGLKYPFRAHAVKSILAVVNRPCEVGRLYPLQLLRTVFVRPELINLNLITPVSKTGANPDSKNIVGFNEREVFAIGATKNKVKTYADLDKVLDFDDYCIDFTLQNNGNVFVSQHFLQQNKNVKKQFVQLTSHAIVKQLLRSEEGLDCECDYSSSYSGSNVCELIYSKEKPAAKKAGTKS